MEPGRAAHLFRNTHPLLHTTNTLWQTAHSLGTDDVESSAATMERLVTQLGSPKVDFGLRDLRGMASIHLLGGGYFNTIWHRNLGIIAAVTAVKRNYGVRIYATGQGLLPHESESQEWMKAQLAQFDYVESRDARGSALFDIHAGTDDAFLAFQNSRPVYADRADLPDAMVLVQGDMVDEERVGQISACIDDFLDAAGPDASVGFAEAIPPEDGRFAESRVRDGAEFFPFMRIWDEGFPAYEGQTWLTSRFHFHLLAAAAGARGTVLNVRPGYYDIKHELLLELGTGWTLQSEEKDASASAPATSLKSFPAHARKLGRHKARLARRLYPM